MKTFFNGMFNVDFLLTVFVVLALFFHLEAYLVTESFAEMIRNNFFGSAILLEILIMCVVGLTWLEMKNGKTHPPQRENSHIGAFSALFLFLFIGCFFLKFLCRSFGYYCAISDWIFLVVGIWCFLLGFLIFICAMLNGYFEWLEESD